MRTRCRLPPSVARVHQPFGGDRAAEAKAIRRTRLAVITTTTVACNPYEFHWRFCDGSHKLWMTRRCASPSCTSFHQFASTAKQQQACNQTVAHLRASSLLHCVLRSPSCVLTNEIVLNVTIASSDSQSSGASLLDFVEKLIHRFDGIQETSACDLNFRGYG